jgi:hypothetical protein
MNAVAKDVVPLKLDIGCGKNKIAGFTGVDSLSLPGVDVVLNVVDKDKKGYKRWPWEDGSVAEVHCSHFLEHLNGMERIHFFNELYRVMRVGATAKIITPYWCSSRAYGDPTHQWPPVGEMSYYYLSKDWRDTNSPHCDSRYVPWGYACDFHAVWGYGMNQAILTRTPEYQQYAMNWYKEAAQDMHATLTKK